MIKRILKFWLKSIKIKVPPFYKRNYVVLVECPEAIICVTPLGDLVFTHSAMQGTIIGCFELNGNQKTIVGARKKEIVLDFIIIDGLNNRKFPIFLS